MGYLDDFLIIECSEDRALAARQFVMDLFVELGLPLQLKKFEEEGAPSLEKIFLGIVIDTARNELRLDSERLAQIKEELASWSGRVDASVREISQLVGVLAFAAKVIRPGRLYLSRLIAALRAGVPGPVRYSARRRLSADFQADLRWWTDVMPSWNGISIIPPLLPLESPDLIFKTDASGWGYGGFCGPTYFFGEWPEEFLNFPWWINSRELAAIVMACILFGERIRGKHLVVYSDNLVSVDNLAVGHSLKSDVQNHLLRRLHAAQTADSFTLTVRHIRGVSNIEADHLSRNNELAFLAHVAPQVPLRVTVPPSLWESLSFSSHSS
jgi:hypothetical protein